MWVCTCMLELENWNCGELEQSLALYWRNAFAVREPSPSPGWQLFSWHGLGEVSSTLQATEFLSFPV